MSDARVVQEAARRRTFAIISHPDAGKTTLTEKLLLYAGAVGEAGSVTARRGQRAATSDWMDLERRRGISVTSTVLRFEHEDIVFNLLDTPGHKDFSEDTLRVLAAVDAAVILIDAARGVEPQTEQLFQVARARSIPLIAFVNKYDRPGMEPLGMVDHLTETLGLPLAPLTWPVGIPGSFRGVIDRRDSTFHQFTRVTGGSAIAQENVVSARGQADADDDEAWAVAEEELELVDEVGSEFDNDAFLRGECIPLLFGSAAWNFGIGLLLDALRELAPSARPRAIDDGTLRPVDAPFAALVFKVQANMDPRHRDRVAFVRICSGRFERGMRVNNIRTGRSLALNFAHEVFGQERAVLDEAFPGDVVGVVIGGDVRVGDTLYEGPAGALPAHPDADAGVLRDDLQPRRQPPQAVPPRARAARPGGRRPRPAARAHAGPGAGAGRRRPDAVRGRHRAPEDRVRRRGAHGAAAVEGRAAHRSGGRGRGLADTGSTDVFVRGDGTQLAVFPNRFVLERFAQRNPTVRLERLIGADEPLS